MMNNIQDYENLIELLKQALLFYANENNYEKTKFSELKGNISAIDMDEYGSQARFALNKIKETREINEKLLNDYEAEVNAIQNNGEEEILNALETLNKMNNGNINI
jgi:hypothetical protein